MECIWWELITAAIGRSRIHGVSNGGRVDLFDWLGETLAEFAKAEGSIPPCYDRSYHSYSYFVLTSLLFNSLPVYTLSKSPQLITYSKPYACYQENRAAERR